MNRLTRKSNKKVTLYHGTSSIFINDIFKFGILPEGYTGNTMFNYNDYNRKGFSKHPDSVYLTNNLENAKKYSRNAVKKKGGFPIILKVVVDDSFLTWDDDALYQFYKKFDFGEKDTDKMVWKKKPKDELWEQSIKINKQCSHHGVINVEQIQSFFINSKWLDKNNFNEVLKHYEEEKINFEKINEDAILNLRDFSVDFDNKLSFTVSIIDRDIYIYNLRYTTQDFELSQNEKTAFSISLMENIKNNTFEFGAKITYDEKFIKLGINPKYSSFNYVFGIFESCDIESLINHLNSSIRYVENKNQTFDKIIKGTANEKEFEFIFQFSIDFFGDLISYCQNKLNNNNQQVMENLIKIKENYPKFSSIIDEQINYLKIKNEN